MEWKDNIVYYDNDDVMYQVHSADRIGQNTGKWVCQYCTRDERPVQAYIDFELEGYMGIKNAEIVFCGGNGMFCAVGVPLIALHNSIEEAKNTCEFHNLNPNNSRLYTNEECKKDSERNENLYL